MYPFMSWSDEELRRRFDAMAAAELHPELLVVAHRLIEQMLKRVLRCELAGRGLRIQKKVGVVSLVTAGNLAELDTSLHEQVESMRTLERAWRVAMVKSVEPNLPALVDRLCGAGTWAAIRRPLTQPAFRPDASLGIRGPGQGDDATSPQLRHGVEAARFHIVEGWNAPDPATVAALAPFAARVALTLADAETGLVAAGLRDPRLRCVPFGSQR